MTKLTAGGLDNGVFRREIAMKKGIREIFESQYLLINQLPEMATPTVFLRFTSDSLDVSEQHHVGEYVLQKVNLAWLLWQSACRYSSAYSD